VIGIPEPGFADTLSVAMMTEPGIGRRVKRRLIIVAEHCDRVAFDISAQAASSRLVFDGQPEKRLGA
jgi:hypothetical protein